MTDHLALAGRIAALLARSGPGVKVDDGIYDVGRPEEFKPASVLVPFVDRARPTILLTRRPDHMRDHAGQVAFPGGKADPDDSDAIATALREAEEEIGLAADAVHVIGSLAPYYTFHRYRITPVLAVISPDVDLQPDPHEVDRIFEVHCDHIFDDRHQTQHFVDFEGGRRSYWEMMAEGERIWGVTATMLRNIGLLLGLTDSPAMLNRATIS